MEPDKIKDLPVWFQLIAYGGIFFGTAAIAILGWIKKNVSGGLFGETDKLEKAVVLTASFTDKQAMANLTEAIQALCVQIRRNDVEDRDDLDRLRRDHRDLVESLDRLTRAINAKGLIL